MENYETLTTLGTGTRDLVYDVNLITYTRVYHERSNEITRQIIEYCIRFRDPKTQHSDIRIFSTEEERSAFLNKNFTHLNLSPVENPQPVQVKYPLNDLVGKYLSSITFFMDYVKIEIDGSRFIFYYWPIIQCGEQIITHKKIRYQNELCKLIGNKIKLVDEYLDLGLLIEFEDSRFIHIPLKVEEAYPIPHIAEYHGLNHEWILWQVGDPPFE
ncbi:MAG: hypothetical protein ABFD51_12265 [Anaerolineaceae bacterium]